VHTLYYASAGLEWCHCCMATQARELRGSPEKSDSKRPIHTRPCRIGTCSHFIGPTQRLTLTEPSCRRAHRVGRPAVIATG